MNRPKQTKDKWFLEYSSTGAFVGSVLSAGMRLCEESVICKVASTYSLNSKQVSLWIFNSRGELKFVLFYLLIEIL